MKTKKLQIFGGLGFISLVGFVLIFNNYTNDTSFNNGKNEEVTSDKNINFAIEYTNILKADPKTGKVDPAAIKMAIDQANQISNTRGSLGLQWESRGPDNIGGRTRALVIDKDDPNTLYAGSVAGGIYKSTNAGESWTRKIYQAEAQGLIISYMVQGIDGALYASTGEANFASAPGYASNTGAQGNGVYKSTDKGETWTHLSMTSSSRWENVQALAADPINAQKIYAATSNGIQVTEDGGDTWTSAAGSSSSATYFDIKISPDGNTVYATTDRTIQKSVNGGNFATSHVISPSSRISLAISTSDPNYVYALSAGGDRKLKGIYQTIDNGENWTEIVSGGTNLDLFGSNGQGLYDNCIAVDPTNRERVFVGGVDMYCYNEGFYYKVASLSEFLGGGTEWRNPGYVHADKHLILFDTKSKINRMWVTSDGGITVTSNPYDKYPAFAVKNANYATTQFYALAASRIGDILGGTQDNGSLRIEVDGHTGRSGYEVLGGDGFYSEISKFIPEIFFYESQHARLYRSDNRGKSRDSLLKKSDFPYSIPSDYSNFNTPFRIWEKEIDTLIIDTFVTQYDTIYDTTTTVVISKFFMALYMGNSLGGIWMTEDAMDFTASSIQWTQIAQIGGMLLCIEYSPDGDAIFVGTANGNLHRVSGIHSGNYTLESLRSFGKPVAGIGVNPNTGNQIIVTLGSYTSGDHVYMSTNALDSSHLVTFTSIHGNLPGIPVYDGEIHLKDTNQIILGTEFGVYTTDNPHAGSVVWTEENLGMDRTPTYMIRQVHEKPWHNGSIFYIATHGMGLFSTSSLCDNRSIQTREKQSYKSSLLVFPNPCKDKLKLSFNLDNSSQLKAQIYDIQGRVVKNITIKNAHAGENLVTINVENLIPGTYFVRMSDKKITLTSRFIVVK